MEGLEDLVNCPICFERFSFPKTLKCHHSICGLCLCRIVKAKVVDDYEKVVDFTKLALQCPSCNEECKDFKSLNSFKPTLVLRQLLDRLPSDQKSLNSEVETRECCSCEENRKSWLLCMKCDKNFCERCWTQDVGGVKTCKAAGHLVARRDRQQEEDVYLCWNHNLPLQYFCFDCKKAICLDCYLTTHQEAGKADHKINTIENARFEVMHESQQVQSLFDVHKQDLKYLVNEKERAMSVFEDHRTDALKKLKEIQLRYLGHMCYLLDDRYQKATEMFDKLKTNLSKEFDMTPQQSKLVDGDIDVSQILKVGNLAEIHDLKLISNMDLITSKLAKVRIEIEKLESQHMHNRYKQSGVTTAASKIYDHSVREISELLKVDGKVYLDDTYDSFSSYLKKSVTAISSDLDSPAKERDGNMGAKSMQAPREGENYEPNLGPDVKKRPAEGNLTEKYQTPFEKTMLSFKEDESCKNADVKKRPVKIPENMSKDQKSYPSIYSLNQTIEERIQKINSNYNKQLGEQSEPDTCADDNIAVTSKPADKKGSRPRLVYDREFLLQFQFSQEVPADFQRLIQNPIGWEIISPIRRVRPVEIINKFNQQKRKRYSRKFLMKFRNYNIKPPGLFGGYPVLNEPHNTEDAGVPKRNVDDFNTAHTSSAEPENQMKPFSSFAAEMNNLFLYRDPRSFTYAQSRHAKKDNEEEDA